MRRNLSLKQGVAKAWRLAPGAAEQLPAFLARTLRTARELHGPSLPQVLRPSSLYPYCYLSTFLAEAIRMARELDRPSLSQVLRPKSV